MLKLILKVNNIINLNNDTEITAPVINNLTENWLLDLSNQFTYVTSWTESLLLFLLLFFIGLSGIVFNYRNYLVTMLCIEIMYLGITVCFLIVSVATSDPKGQIYALILLIAAAAESAIGLGVLVVLYKFGKSIDFADYQELRG
jgi:NADH:ubiquinone oxidoreductase subunit K